MKSNWRIFPAFHLQDTKDVIDISRTGATAPSDNDSIHGQQRQGTNTEEIDTSTNCAKTKSILASLTDDEIEVAARTYYEYALDNPLISTSATAASNNDRRKWYAAALANQYIHWYKNESVETIVRNLKDNIRFRTEHQIDQLRFAHTNRTSEDYTTLRNYIGQKKVYVSGYDMHGRSTYYFIPRNVKSHDPQYTRKVHLWTMERAIACSKHTDRTINAIVDFNGFSTSQHSPPISIGKDLLRTLSYHYYSNHIHNVFLVDAPIPFMYMWSMVFKHFINKRTASKIHFINRSAKKSSSTTLSSRHEPELHPNQQPLYHSIEPNTKNAKSYHLSRPEKHLKQPFLPIFRSLPFWSNAMQNAASTSPSTPASSSAATGLLRAGGDGSNDSRIPATSHTTGTWTSSVFRRRRDKRAKSTSVYSIMNSDGNENERYTTTDTCTANTPATIDGTLSEDATTSGAGSANIQSDSLLRQLYTFDQVPSWIIPTGTKNRELDVDEYLDGIPFNRAFDE